MIETKLNSEEINILCDKDTLLTEYSFCVEQALMWFFGQGIFKTKIWKSRLHMEGGHTLIQNLNCKKQQFTFGSVAILADLQQYGFLPTLFLAHEIWKVEDKVDFIEYGNLQITLGKNETSIIMIGYHDSSNSISQLAYDLSDLIITVLMFCDDLKIQTSTNVTQIVFKKAFKDAEEVKNFIDFKLNYKTEEKIDILFK